MIHKLSPYLPLRKVVTPRLWSHLSHQKKMLLKKTYGIMGLNHIAILYTDGYGHQSIDFVKDKL